MSGPHNANAPMPDAAPDAMESLDSAEGGPTATMTVHAPRPRASLAPAEPPAIPKEVVCPICATRFDPRAAGGRCPVCGEQVIPVAEVTRDVPGLSAAGRWLGAGGWRAVVVTLLIVYQIVLFIFIWHSFVVNHLL